MLLVLYIHEQKGEAYVIDEADKNEIYFFEPPYQDATIVTRKEMERSSKKYGFTEPNTPIKFDTSTLLADFLACCKNISNQT